MSRDDRDDSNHAGHCEKSPQSGTEAAIHVRDALVRKFPVFGAQSIAISHLPTPISQLPTPNSDHPSRGDFTPSPGFCITCV